MKKKIFSVFLVMCFLAATAFALDAAKEEQRKKELEQLQQKFEWWPTDAQPAPVKDEQHSGYWWWPKEPGKARPWGNRGFVYVYKIIFDYKEEELPVAKPKELRPSLLIKKIVKNVKIYFDYDKADLREDACKILEDAVGTLKRNPETSILISGNCDVRGSESYNDKLGRRRAETVKSFMLDKGITEEKIKIISRGKLDAAAPVSDIVGMQKDRNAQFMIAEVEEVMIPYPDAPQSLKATATDDGKYLIEKEEKVESAVKVATKIYIVQKNDSLWSIAEKQLGSGHRWKYLYEMNQENIKNPNKLKTGTKLVIPVE